MRVKAKRGRKRMHLLSDLMKGKYVTLKRTAEDSKECMAEIDKSWKVNTFSYQITCIVYIVVLPVMDR